MISIQIIGIDCATDSSRIGLARGVFVENEDLVIQSVEQGSGKGIDEVAKTIGKWTTNAPPTLLALDAPLGWPMAAGWVLNRHQAGFPIDILADEMFRRKTDDDIYRRFGKRPLEVGANLISRTAVAALKLIGAIKQSEGLSIPLAWPDEDINSIAAIEVYPAATLAAYGIVAKGYRTDYEKRAEILKQLEDGIQIRCDRNEILVSDHRFDAFLCVRAGADFLKNDAIGPREASPMISLDMARKEGWIWVRKKLVS